MPIGEFIGEVLLRGVFEIIFYTLAYYTGAVTIGIFTLGQLRIAPLSSIDTTNRGKNRWTDWSIWLHRSAHGRVLKAECVCLAGMFVWIIIGVGIYFIFSSTKKESEQGAAPNAYPRHVSCLVASLPAGAAPRVAVGDLGR